MGRAAFSQEVPAMAAELGVEVGSGAADPADTVVQLSVLKEALLRGFPHPRTDHVGQCSRVSRREYRLCRTSSFSRGQALKGPLLVCLDEVNGLTAVRPRLSGACRFAWPWYGLAG